MNKKLFYKMGRVCAVGMLFVGMNALVACNPEPDESDMYTSVQETAEDFISRKPELTSFNAILTKVGLNRNLSAYGEYTCFVPTNEAIDLYLDSLYNDEVAAIPHNGLSENSLQGILDPNNEYSDSLCNDIAKYHLANGITTSVDMGSGTSIRMMLGRTINAGMSDRFKGLVALEEGAAIIEPDSLVSNGVVHVINRVIPRSNRTLSDEIERHSEYGIFIEALKLTGLIDSLTATKKNATYSLTDKNSEDNGSNAGKRCYWPDECQIKYTIFAEPDEVMKPALEKAGFTPDINGLIGYAKSIYADARDWYDYLEEMDITPSTGDDYTNRFNTLNMFVAYHILYAGMPVTELVWEQQGNRWTGTWNYVNGCGPFDYYETMLPHTLLKIWQPVWRNTTTYINRYVMNNTLTDQLGELGIDGMGSAAMHPVIRQGMRVVRTSTDSYQTNISAFNGYIHALLPDDGRLLIYDRLVPQGVLHERMRFDSTTFLPEFINNGIRMATSTEIAALSKDKHGARVAFPLNFFDGVVSYTDENQFRYNVKGAYNAWQGDTFQGWGNYDLAIKMPPLPTGVYEFRIFYTPMSHGGMMMFYMGDSKKLSSMVPLDIPLDVRIAEDDPRIGSTYYYDEEDMGIATDAAMRNRGFMRGLYSYKDHVDREAVDHADTKTSLNQRSNQRNTSLRKIMSRSLEVKQSGEKWFRIKNVIPDETDLKWQFDYIEFVPLDVVGNTTYSEDWF
ncbi:MAG: fasciclin domain-containing protein [Prevotella sp.]|nr:fasciclin domain-containing protein [Prevotella sp.]